MYTQLLLEMYVKIKIDPFEINGVNRAQMYALHLKHFFQLESFINMRQLGKDTYINKNCKLLHSASQNKTVAYTYKIM